MAWRRTQSVYHGTHKPPDEFDFPSFFPILPCSFLNTFVRSQEVVKRSLHVKMSTPRFLDFAYVMEKDPETGSRTVDEQAASDPPSRSSSTRSESCTVDSETQTIAFLSMRKLSISSTTRRPLVRDDAEEKKKKEEEEREWRKKMSWWQATTGKLSAKALLNLESLVFVAISMKSQTPGDATLHVICTNAPPVMIAETVSLGILSLPAAVRAIGLVPGSILTVGFGVITTYTGYVVHQFKMRYPDVGSFADAGELIAGPVGRWIVEAMTGVFLFFISS